MGSLWSSHAPPPDAAYQRQHQRVRCVQCGLWGPHSRTPYMARLYGEGIYDGRALCLPCLRAKLVA